MITVDAHACDYLVLLSCEIEDEMEVEGEIVLVVCVLILSIRSWSHHSYTHCANLWEVDEWGIAHHWNGGDVDGLIVFTHEIKDQ